MIITLFGWLMKFRIADDLRWSEDGKVLYFDARRIYSDNRVGYRLIVGPFAFWAARLNQKGMIA